MKNLYLLLLGILIFPVQHSTAQERREIGNMILEDVPEIPLEIKERIQQYQNTRSAFLADWMPGDAGILISTRFGNTNQLHIVGSPGAFRNQVTFFGEPVTNGTFCPMPEYSGFLFTKDEGGNEFSQIFWYDMKSRNAEMLSDGTSVNFGILWSNRGDRFAFTSTRRNKVDFDVYVSSMDAPKDAELKVDRGTGYWIPADWSADDSQLIIVQYLSSTKTNSFILDLGTGKLSPLNNEGKESIFSAQAWDRSGKNIYVITDEGKEFSTLATYNIESGKISYITKDIPWDVVDFAVNKENTQAAFTVNENGFSRLYLMDLVNNAYKAVTSLPIGQVSSLKFHPSGDKLGLVLNTTETPGDIYSLDVKTGQAERWTYSEVGGLNTAMFPTPELIHFKTYDEVDGQPREIPAFLYKPKQAAGKLPVLISIHGGPEGQHIPNFSSFYAYLANELGIAVIAPNVRGSSGYGKTYLKLDNGFNRENSVKDIGELIGWIKNNPEFDGSRIAVFGGSYGGYMVLSSMFNYNEELKCGIDIVGISNFVTFLENTEEYRRDLRRVEYGDEREPDMRAYLESISPTNHVDKITKPLFVIQGANDPRVPATESEQMVKSIRENGGTVWYMLAKDEGHGFRKKDNRDRMYEAVACFLKEHLLGE